MMNGGKIVDENIRQKLYDNVEDSWDFVLRAVANYKIAFNKTSKIGVAPKIDDIIEKTLIGEDIEVPEIDKDLEKEE